MNDYQMGVMRTHTCGELRINQVGRDVVLMGWVHKIRDLGGVIFIDLRDRHGVTQVVARDDSSLIEITENLLRLQDFLLRILRILGRIH